MAANLLYMLPPLIIFFVAQRYFIQGLGSLGTVNQRRPVTRRPNTYQEAQLKRSRHHAGALLRQVD